MAQEVMVVVVVAVVEIYFCAGSPSVRQCCHHSHLQLIRRDRLGDGQTIARHRHTAAVGSAKDAAETIGHEGQQGMVSPMHAGSDGMLGDALLSKYTNTCMLLLTLKFITASEKQWKLVEILHFSNKF